MKKQNLLIIFLFSCFNSPIFSQLNIQLLANEDYPVGCNDVWGYADSETGIEYAILGTTRSTVIYSLEDPRNPELIIDIDGPSSTWRDMKQYGDYIYSIDDSGAAGLLIIDMSNLPDTILYDYRKLNFTLPDGTNSMIYRCHNIYIDEEEGFLYLSGCNFLRGVSIYDLNEDPENPKYVGHTTNQVYSHDNFARGDRLYSAEINKGTFAIFDITDKANPLEIASQTTSYNFTHNVWPSDDGKVLFTTDERDNAFLDAYDISDLDNIRLLDRYRPIHTGVGSTPHNTHYHDGFLVTSWYTDGIKIIDASRPNNLVEVGFYDTDTLFTSGFNGCWGAYPFLPSGLLLASDRKNGLFVFEADYVQASFLEGEVTSLQTGALLSNVEVVIEGGQANESFSDIEGIYRTGVGSPGTYNVRYFKDGYAPVTIEVDFISGEVLRRDIVLDSRSDLEGHVLASSNGAPIDKAQVVVLNKELDCVYETMTDSFGHFVISNFYPDDYQLIAGKWGFLHANTTLQTSVNNQINIILEEGYQDDFVLDQNWSISGTALEGVWERGEPKGTYSPFGIVEYNPEMDIGNDIGNKAYVTGNQGVTETDDDVDYGKTLLSSPLMDLSNYEDPILHFHFWFTVPNRPPYSSVLEAHLVNGSDTALIWSKGNNAFEWLPSPDLSLKNFLELTDQMQIVFSVEEILNETLIEAGIDAFWIEDRRSTAVSDFSTDFSIQCFPNPSKKEISLKFSSEKISSCRLEVFNSLGQLVEEEESLSRGETFWMGADWEKGVYIARLSTSRGNFKLIKLLRL